MAKKATFRKGDTVRVRFDSRRTGVPSYRAITAEERREWRESDSSKGMTCDGETKIIGSETCIHLPNGTVATVVRVRAVPLFSVNWRRFDKATLIRLPSGEEVYIKRATLEKVTEFSLR